MPQNPAMIQINLTRRHTAVLLFTILIFAIALFASRRQVHAALDDNPLRARTLEIVDSAGVARMRLAAPAPDPVTDGKSSPRRSPMTGIQLNDAKGDEIGGLGMLDDGTLTLCFDTHRAEATCMYVLPSGERGFSVTDDHGTDRAKMVLNSDNTVALLLNDAKGKRRADMQMNKTGSAEVRVLDEKGTILWGRPVF